MSDLIERLRKEATPGLGYSIHRGPLCDEAADEIERLKAALKEAAKSLAEDEQEIERLRAVVIEKDYLDEIAIIFDAAEDWRNELAEYIEPCASDEEKETRLAERHALEDALTTFAPLVAMIRRDRA